MPTTLSMSQVSEVARGLRVDVIQMVANAGSGHLGGALGLAEVFAVLYGMVLSHRPEQPNWGDRDYLLLSNGHVCPIWYATLAEFGYFDKAKLKQLRQLGSGLQGHPHLGALPGIENTSGPLGQGLSQAAGLAHVLLTEKKSNRVYVVLSDGEHQEGQTWEAYQYAGAKNLTNLTVLIDRNQIQIGGNTEQILPLSPLKRKLSSFRWQVIETDGHDPQQIFAACTTAQHNRAPTAIICHTTPGKGVSFMENDFKWHGDQPTQTQVKQALAELRAKLPATKKRELKDNEHLDRNP